MKKQVTALILAIVMIFALLPASALPASAATYSGACGKNLTWTLNTSTGLLEISGTGDMKNYDYNFPSPWNDYNNSIKTVNLNDGVTSIGNNAFGYCTNLKTVTISDSVTTIGIMAFSYCIALASIAIPDSVTSIGGGVFRGCTELREIAVHVDNENYCSVIGALYNKDKTELICCPAGLMGSFSVPDGVTSIGTSAFGFCNLSSISLPDGLKSIGWGAFEYCDKLTSIEIPNSVTSVDDSAFFMCSALASANIPSGLKSVGGSMFAGCALTSVTIPEGVTSIGGDAFQGCPLTSVTLPNSLTSIETWAFSDCNALKDVYYAGTKAEWKKISIGSNNECLTTAKIHYLNEPETPPTSFSDVTEKDWFYSYVDYAVSNGLMNGVGNGKFAPNDSMTRAMLVTVLWRYEGEPKEGVNNFNDVPGGQWYTEAVAWAASKGIVTGIGNGKFNPNGNITREQMAVILCRYTSGKKQDTSARGDFSSFPDRDKVSDWAKDSLGWAVGEGLINGSDGKLVPQGNATRAQVATILMRYLERTCFAHDWVYVSKSSPTCKEEGKTVYKCSHCAAAKVLTEPALGHDFVYGVCSRCNAIDSSNGYLNLLAGDWYITYEFINGNYVSRSKSDSSISFSGNTGVWKTGSSVKYITDIFYFGIVETGGTKGRGYSVLVNGVEYYIYLLPYSKSLLIIRANSSGNFCHFVR